MTVFRHRFAALALLLAGVLAWAPAALAAPDPPTGLTAASPTNTRPSLSWAAAANATGAVTYDVWRGATKLTATPISVRTYIDTSASLPQGSSSYTVTATDSTGTSAASSATTVVYDTVPPPVPTTLTAVTPTNQKPALSWVSGGNDATSGFATYQVYRGAVLVGSPTATTFTDSGLVTSGSQSYTVRATDAAGNVSTGSAAKAVMYDTVTPSAPVLTRTRRHQRLDHLDLDGLERHGRLDAHRLRRLSRRRADRRADAGDGADVHGHRGDVAGHLLLRGLCARWSGQQLARLERAHRRLRRDGPGHADRARRAEPRPMRSPP